MVTPPSTPNPSGMNVHGISSPRIWSTRNGAIIGSGGRLVIVTVPSSGFHPNGRFVSSSTPPFSTHASSRPKAPLNVRRKSSSAYWSNEYAGGSEILISFGFSGSRHANTSIHSPYSLKPPLFNPRRGADTSNMRTNRRSRPSTIAFTLDTITRCNNGPPSRIRTATGTHTYKAPKTAPNTAMTV